MLAAAVAIVASACGKKAPFQPHLVIERDTLVIYGANSTYLPVEVVDARGKTTFIFTASVRRVEQSILTASGASVSCRRAGTARVHISAKGLSDSIFVECRPARSINPLDYIQMDLGDAPRSLSTIALLASGDTDIVTPVRSGISDTTVAVIRNNEVVPLAVGRATLRIDWGGVRASTFVEVRERITDGVLTLKAGEARRWELIPGRYDITVKVKTGIDLTALHMETDGANCARDFRNEDMIHCVVNERGSVSMTNTSAPLRARTSRALVTILRTP